MQEVFEKIIEKLEEKTSLPKINGMERRVGRFHTDHWKTDEGIVENSVVIAWKPLPHPYQPKGDYDENTN